MKVQLLIKLIFFVFIMQQSKLHSQDSVIVSKIQALEAELTTATQERNADIELILSEYYWQVQPETGAQYGKQAIESFRKLKSDKISNAYVNTAICFYYCAEMDSCIFYIEEMLETYGSKLTDRKLGVSNNILCVSYRRIGKYESALKYGNEALKHYRLCADSLHIAGTLDNISLIYKKWGKYEDALSYSLRSLTIFEDKKDSIDIGGTLFNIGDLYFELNDFVNAKIYFKNAQQIAQATKHLILLADISDELGRVYQTEKKLDSALVLYKDAMKLYKQISNKAGEAMALQNIGAVKLQLGDFKQGVDILKKSLSIFQSVNLHEDVTEVYIDLGSAYIHLNAFDSATYYLSSALKNSKEMHNIDLQLRSMTGLQEAYFTMGSFDKAYHIQTECFHLKDSLQNIEVALKLAELHTKYDVESEKKQTELWKNQQQIEASKTKMFRIVVIALIAFIILGGFFEWQRRKKIREINKLKQEKNRIIKDEMEAKMHFQSKQLTTHALNMLQKNNLLFSLQEDIDRISPTAKAVVKPELRSMIQKIKSHLKGEKDWGLFKMYFEQINKEFFTTLYKISPDLTSNDLRLLALIKLNMNIKEAASVLNISPDSVKNARYRLRKKLKLNSQDELFEFVNRIAK